MCRTRAPLLHVEFGLERPDVPPHLPAAVVTRRPAWAESDEGLSDITLPDGLWTSY